MKQKCVMIIAGEASGDLHGANLVRAMKEKFPHLFFCGIGGERLEAAGVRILVDASRLSVVGITEAVAKSRTLLGGIRNAKEALRALKPDLLILIDFPDFNLHIAGHAKKIGIPVLYYISPQIWAWRRGRVKKIKKRVDHMAVILPFEKDFYEKAGVPATFVGHPLMDREHFDNVDDGERPDTDEPVIGFLPGSRSGEIHRHLPVMVESIRLLNQRIPGATYMISVAPTVDKSFIESAVKSLEAEPGNIPTVVLAEGDVRGVFSRSLLVVAVSGTVTLEAALSGTPLMVIYKMSFLSYWLVRALIQIRSVSLVNLIAGKPIVPELLQSEASPDRIADAVEKRIRNPEMLAEMVSDLTGVQNAMGKGGASERTADIALRMLLD